MLLAMQGSNVREGTEPGRPHPCRHAVILTAGQSRSGRPPAAQPGWFEWDFEVQASPMAQAFHDLQDLPLHGSGGSQRGIPQEIPLDTRVPCEIGGSAFPRMTLPYEPPFTVTPRVLDLVMRISEEIGRQGWSRGASMTPALQRGNRLRSIQASLAIDNNPLSLDQVTAVIAGNWFP